MGLNNTLGFLVCRLRILLLMILIIIIVAWTTMYLFESTRYTSRHKIKAGTFWRVAAHEEEKKDKSQTAMEDATKGLDVKTCPQLSTNLKGILELSFNPSLTIEEVQSKNPSVENGVYQPESCRAQQRVAILIPHRNREKHLLYLLDNLHPFLQRQQLEYGIYVIHQAGNMKFNRAKLLNIGYLEALKEKKWDCFIFHDVDLVPENDFNLYLCDSEPKHLVVGRNATGYRLRYKGYFGGVSAMTRDQFAKVNGYSNNYWGWGGEDDDLRQRVVLQNMKVVRPFPDIGRYTMIFHKRDNGNEVNQKRMQLLDKVSKVWMADGLNSCSYELLSTEHNPLYINFTVDIGGPDA